MKLENDIKLDFNDVLLRPKRSTLNSRKEVNLIREFKFKHSNQTWSGVPIISSNMDTVSSIDMFKVLSENKMLTCFDKYIDVNALIANVNQTTKDYYILSTGITEANLQHLNSVMTSLKEVNLEPKFICIDVANGYMFQLIEFCKTVRKLYPDKILIAGNVVSREVTEELLINAIDIVKVGIGSGAVCTTRLQTGVGMPQFSAIMECSDAAHGLNGMIISDGGICHPGDLGKAFGGGADFVMGGSIFAGHDECPGEVIEENGEKYKLFYGMSSSAAMEKHHGGVANYRSSEGKSVKIKLKGPLQNTINDLLGGLRSTCTYIGACRIKDINKCATFMRVNRIVNTFYK